MLRNEQYCWKNYIFTSTTLSARIRKCYALKHFNKVSIKALRWTFHIKTTRLDSNISRYNVVVVNGPEPIKTDL